MFDEEREAWAKALCVGCAVSSECLQLALVAKEPFGVWGGKNPAERRTIARKIYDHDRRIGRYGTS